MDDGVIISKERPQLLIMCSLNACQCLSDWVDRGWICPAIWDRKDDPKIQKGNILKFKRCSRIWSGKHGEPGSRLIRGHGWHGGRSYEVLEINRTHMFTQVLVCDDDLGFGWVNIWKRCRTGNVVWAF